MMGQTPLSAYEIEQIARIASWKARKPGFVRRAVETLKWPLDQLFERLIPCHKARAMLAKAHHAADWEQYRRLFSDALGIDNVEDLRTGPLERCDRLVSKLCDLDREIITSESLLADAGGLPTELLGLPAEIMLALRAVHDVAACYGYRLQCPDDESLVFSVIGLSLVTDPAERLKGRRLIRELEERRGSGEDRERLLTTAQRKIEDDVCDDAVEVIGSTLLEEKLEEGIPLLGAAIGVVLDNAFIRRVEDTAQFVFQERWLRDQGKVEEILPAESAEPNHASISLGLARAVYSTSYAVSFGVVFPAALIAQAGASVLPIVAVEGLKEGAAAANQDADRVIGGSRSA